MSPARLDIVRVEGKNDGPTNMACDMELLERAYAGEICCRIYEWDGPWVSLGRFQRPESALLATNQVPWVMRPTGGGGVLHGHDVTVGLAAPLDLLVSRKERRSLRRAHRAILDPLVSALRESGLNAALGAARARTPNRADCFLGVSENDVVDARTGVKVCGCALRFTRTALLLQASIPAGVPLADPAAVFTEAHGPVLVSWEVPSFPGRLEDELRRLT